MSRVDVTYDERGEVAEYTLDQDNCRDLWKLMMLSPRIEICEALMRDESSRLTDSTPIGSPAPNVGLKEEAVAVVLAQIKAGLCDRTGATVSLVDHAPWPTEGNRGQRRAYGSVFKTAAVRWSIHLEADVKDDTRLHVEASGTTSPASAERLLAGTRTNSRSGCSRSRF
jgi:hypothetical protein